MKSSLRIIKGYSDGSCCKDRRGGWGACYTYHTGKVNVWWSDYGRETDTTNQRMEMRGCIALLRLLPTPCRATLYLDSKYVLGGIVHPLTPKIDKTSSISGWIVKWNEKGWEKIKNQDLWREIASECENHQRIGSTLNFQWVKGHSGNEGNDLADRLSTQYRR